MSYIQTNQIVHLEYEDTEISAADSGKFLITPQTAGAVDVTYTLPSLQSGLHYRFINGSPAAMNGLVRIALPAGGTMYGTIINGPVDGVEFKEVDGDTELLFANVSVRGDFIDCICDGTYWFIDARGRVANGII